MAASQGLFLLLFTSMAGNEYTLYLFATLIGFNFGGNFALFPALTADEFGNEAVGKNYPWVFLSYGAGGIIFPILGGWLGDLGNFPLAFFISGGLCLVGAAASSPAADARGIEARLVRVHHVKGAELVESALFDDVLERQRVASADDLSDALADPLPGTVRRPGMAAMPKLRVGRAHRAPASGPDCSAGP